jgi:hypothetical protein
MRYRVGMLAPGSITRQTLEHQLVGDEAKAGERSTGHHTRTTTAGGAGLIGATMEPKNNGGAAFPTSESNYNAKYSGEGMTLRDYFAAKAMLGLCTHADNWGCTKPEIAKVAYEMADLMLAERAK